MTETGDTSEKETGVYGVVMGVMEECLDGLIVTTKMNESTSIPRCEVLSIKSYGDRDCG